MKQERRNRNIAFAYFQAIGKIPKDATKGEWCLHHVDAALRYTDKERYDEWRIEDLVPMKTSDHMKLHAEDRLPMSEETKAKISGSMKGHAVSDETKAKISAAQKGKKVPDEVIKKRLETYRRNHPPKPEKEKGPDGRKGLLWINDGVRNSKIRSGDPLPEGWTFGRLGFVRTKNPPLGPMTGEHRRKISEARRGIKFSEEHRRRLSEVHRRNPAA